MHLLESEDLRPSASEAIERSFVRVRALTDELAAGLSDADARVQALADTSPANWKRERGGPWSHEFGVAGGWPNPSAEDCA